MHPAVLRAAERGRGGVRRAAALLSPQPFPQRRVRGPNGRMGCGGRSARLGRPLFPRWVLSGSRALTDLLLLLPSPPLAARLLAHKIQSPQEVEALHALTVSAFGHV